jgi:hypothetical protein
MIRLFPQLENAEEMSNARPNMDFLVARLGLRHDKEHWDLRKMILSSPQVLGYSIDDNMEPKLLYLEKRFALDADDLRKMIILLPQVLGYSIDDNMEPKLAYFERRFVLTPDELRTMIMRIPLLFGLSIDDNLEPKLAYLETRLSLTPEEVRSMILKNPVLLSFNIVDNLDPKLQYLETRFSLSPTEARSLLLRRVFFFAGADIDKNLEPTISFFESILGAEVLPLLVKHPVLLNYSLANRLIPRSDRMVKAGMAFDQLHVRRCMCDMTDLDFDAWLEDYARSNMNEIEFEAWLKAGVIKR